MNLLAETTLSTQRKAYYGYRVSFSLLRSELQYVYVVQWMDNNNYKLMIYIVTYPDKNEEKLGKPRMAEKHHFEKQCSLENLAQFMEERGWNIDNGWMPLEDDTDVVA